MNYAKKLKLMSYCILLLIAENVFFYIFEFVIDRDKYVSLFEVAGQDASAINSVLILIGVFVAIIALFQFFLGWKFLQESNGKVSSKVHHILAIIYIVIAASGLITSFKAFEANRTGIISLLLDIVLMGSALYYSYQLKKER